MEEIMLRFWKDLKGHYRYAIFSAKASLKSEVASSYLNWIWWILDHVFADFDVDVESLKNVLVWSAGRLEIASPTDGQAITIELY